MTAPRFEQRIQSSTSLVARAGGGIVFVIALLVCGDIFSRNILNRIVFHSFELANYLFAISAAFGMAYALVKRVHIRIDVLHGRFPGPLRRAIDFLALLSTTAVAALFAYKGWDLAVGNIARGVTANSTLGMPIGYPQAAWALGLSFFALIAFALTIRHLLLLIARQTARADVIGSIGSDMPTEARREKPANAEVTP
ncbi:TRAP transporter small permease subunit [Oceanibacterium hippocampi]|uniref:TRAP transporter small permease protein n=1 Tax=Oceanibacterium hippocampi TaxID=745714 RepID=A0A1Y5TKQ8_9PROT|nr:TRAP transporter small permease [Oceanibacterium hippocampi]SLN65862.1 Tripartite ATP-independent periplasmic transporters, DctQ component [Oceanibacterium hippocampi]